MPVPGDPQDVGARFTAQLLGAELCDGPVPAGSPVWGMQLVERLAEAAGLEGGEVDRVARNYLAARWEYDGLVER